jgi:molecular chaperone IbpA
MNMKTVTKAYGENWAKDFEPFFVGFDNHYSKLTKMYDEFTKNIPNYPPYNIKKIDENKYVIEIAVAGFATQDIEITIDGDKLIIKGNTNEDTQNYLFKGIATRAFTRTFALTDTIEVKDADLVNGMLKIFLENIIPEHKKPKKIEIKDSKQNHTRQFLTENQ